MNNNPKMFAAYKLQPARRVDYKRNEKIANIAVIIFTIILFIRLG